MKKEKPRVRPSRPQWDVIPSPGSDKFEYGSEEMQEYWRKWADSPCFICGQPLGFCCAVLTWLPEENCHLRCHEEKLEEERRFLSQPGLIERTAKALGVTIEAFKGEASWDRARMMREQAERERLAERGNHAAV